MATESHDLHANAHAEHHAAFTMDLRGRATSWNEGVLNVLGFEPHEFIGADLLPLLWTPEDLASGAAQKELEEAGRNGYASDDRWMLRKNKERFWAMGVTTVDLNDAGQPRGYSKLIRDLTQFKRTQDSVAQRTQELAAS